MLIAVSVAALPVRAPMLRALRVTWALPVTAPMLIRLAVLVPPVAVPMVGVMLRALLVLVPEVSIGLRKVMLLTFWVVPELTPKVRLTSVPPVMVARPEALMVVMPLRAPVLLTSKAVESITSGVLPPPMVT
jgi:hypothetical protein